MWWFVAPSTERDQAPLHPLVTLHVVHEGIRCTTTHKRIKRSRSTGGSRAKDDLLIYCLLQTLSERQTLMHERLQHQCRYRNKLPSLSFSHVCTTIAVSIAIRGSPEEPWDGGNRGAPISLLTSHLLTYCIVRDENFESDILQSRP